MFPQTQEVLPSRLAGACAWSPAAEPEPKRPRERRSPAVLGPAGAAEAEAGAAGRSAVGMFKGNLQSFPLCGLVTNQQHPVLL